MSNFLTETLWFPHRILRFHRTHFGNKAIRISTTLLVIGHPSKIKLLQSNKIYVDVANWPVLCKSMRKDKPTFTVLKITRMNIAMLPSIKGPTIQTSVPQFFFSAAWLLSLQNLQRHQVKWDHEHKEWNAAFRQQLWLKIEDNSEMKTSSDCEDDAEDAISVMRIFCYFLHIWNKISTSYSFSLVIFLRYKYGLTDSLSLSIMARKWFSNWVDSNIEHPWIVVLW